MQEIIWPKIFCEAFFWGATKFLENTQRIKKENETHPAVPERFSWTFKPCPGSIDQRGFCREKFWGKSPQTRGGLQVSSANALDSGFASVGKMEVRNEWRMDPARRTPRTPRVKTSNVWAKTVAQAGGVQGRDDLPRPDGPADLPPCRQGRACAGGAGHRKWKTTKITRIRINNQNKIIYMQNI